MKKLKIDHSARLCRFVPLGQRVPRSIWNHHNERLTIRRDQCLSLNSLAEMLCR